MRFHSSIPAIYLSEEKKIAYKNKVLQNVFFCAEKNKNKNLYSHRTETRFKYEFAKSNPYIHISDMCLSIEKKCERNMNKSDTRAHLFR